MANGILHKRNISINNNNNNNNKVRNIDVMRTNRRLVNGDFSTACMAVSQSVSQSICCSKFFFCLKLSKRPSNPTLFFCFRVRKKLFWHSCCCCCRKCTSMYVEYVNPP